MCAYAEPVVVADYRPRGLTGEGAAHVQRIAAGLGGPDTLRVGDFEGSTSSPVTYRAAGCGRNWPCRVLPPCRSGKNPSPTAAAAETSYQPAVEHLWILGRGLLALVVAAALLLAAQRHHRARGDEAPTDIGLD